MSTNHPTSTALPPGVPIGENAQPRKISPPSARGKKRHGNSSNRRGSGSSGSGGHNHHSHYPKLQQQGNSKRQKFHHEPMDLDPIFPKLDQSDPVHAKRIQQRRRSVAIGKNTPGYFEYRKQVPQQDRKRFSMKTPSTPDHTLDIPAKRWHGMVNAWRRALHAYDPPDLVTNLDSALADTSNDAATATAKTHQSNNNHGNVQSRQIEEAIAKGLLVDVCATPRKKKNQNRTDNDNNENDNSMEQDDGFESPISVLSEETRRHNIMDIVEGDNGDVDFGDDDSDDDLL